MAALKERYAGQMDFGKASALVKELLTRQITRPATERLTQQSSCEASLSDIPLRLSCLLSRKVASTGICCMRYGEGLLEEILQRTDLVQLVGRRVKLARKGRVFWGLCPFHKEKSPSFKVENERRTYHCFGCGAGGDAFKWLQETEGLTFPEAVQRLAGEAGVELPAWSPEDEAREAKKKSLYEIIELACQFFEEQLHARAGDAARRYLEIARARAARRRSASAWAMRPDSNPR